MHIRILDAATIGRIAAGEVVERPLSVAKELIENALDAQSSAITVEIREGGNTYLRVTDNGIGIAEGDVRMAFANHATSKLVEGSDLSNIETLGFRGEALPSIAAVSVVEMETRRHDQEYGTKIRVNAGHIEDVSECATRPGTSVIVKDLFYNLPVRRSFLKRGANEAAAVTELVTKMMLGNPGVAFRLISNGRTAHQTFGDGSMRHAALNVYGREFAEKLVELDEMEGGIRINGWVGLGDCARPTRSHQSFFINGRLVRCPMMSEALRDATIGRVMVGMFPSCALQITVPPQIVDVNVHPNKLEVRFRDEVSVRHSLTALFTRGLSTGGMLNVEQLQAPELPVRPRPQIKFIENTATSTKETEVCKQQTTVGNKQTDVGIKKTEVGEVQLLAEQKIEQLKYQFNNKQHSDAQNDSLVLRDARPMTFGRLYTAKPLSTTNAAIENEIPIVPIPQNNDAAEVQSQNALFRVVGVAFNTYVIVETADMLLVIDQHAAHERLLYEHYIQALDKNSVSQQLLTPITMDVSSAEINALIENQEMLQGIGYEIDTFGDNTVQVRAIPQLFGRAEMRPLILSMLDRLDGLKSATLDRKRQDIIRFSCKRAVKAGDRLGEQEIEALIHDMMESGAPPTCPHGRPVIHKINRREVERYFKRV